MDSQTLGLLLMMLGLPLIISIPVTAFLWGSHLRKLEAIRLEDASGAKKNRAELEALAARVRQLEAEIQRRKTQSAS